MRLIERCNIQSECDNACGRYNEQRNGEICDIPNGNCEAQPGQQGYSCRLIGAGFNLRCVSEKCVYAICEYNAPACSPQCSSHGQC